MDWHPRSHVKTPDGGRPGEADDVRSVEEPGPAGARARGPPVLRCLTGAAPRAAAAAAGAAASAETQGN